MGRLVYGTGAVTVEVDDNILFHLDVLIARLRGAAFQLHGFLAGAGDGNMQSLTIGPGIPLILEFYNGPDLRLDMNLIVHAIYEVMSSGILSLSALHLGSDEVGSDV